MNAVNGSEWIDRLELWADTAKLLGLEVRATEASGINVYEIAINKPGKADEAVMWITRHEIQKIEVGDEGIVQIDAGEAFLMLGRMRKL